MIFIEFNEVKNNIVKFVVNNKLAYTKIRNYFGKIITKPVHNFQLWLGGGGVELNRIGDLFFCPTNIIFLFLKTKKLQPSNIYRVASLV